MWVVILFFATFVLVLTFKVLVRSLQEVDVEEVLGSSVLILSTLTRQLVRPTSIIFTTIFHPR